MSPGRADIGSLRTPLTVGEQRVLDFFDTQLSQEWEIYIQPHLNGLRPDFVLLNPFVGIGVFEVKDWNLDAIDYKTVHAWGRDATILATDRRGKAIPKEHPVVKVDRYKSDIINLYCPRLAMSAGTNRKFVSVVTAGVIMTGATTARARELLTGHRGHPEHTGGAREKYHPIVGSDDLEQGALLHVFPTAQEYLHNHSRLMSTEFADDLRSWLIEPDFAEAQRRPLELDARQKELVSGRTARTPSGYRRIKGPAGSGKSLVLAARAAQLTAEGKDVLVVTFNITLWHYLRDLAARYPEPNRRVCSRITWCHFHEWCKRVCREANMEDDYKALWRERVDNGDAQERDGSDEANDVLGKALPALVARAFETNGERITRYDAVLVDEGQDFNLEWWNVLRNAVRGVNDERVLVADATQDLYEKAEQWTESSMTWSGFVGPWTQLDVSYRMPSTLVPLLQKFVGDFLPGTEKNLPLPAQQRLVDDRVQMRWIQVTPQRAVQTCVEAVLSMSAAEETATIAFTDITLLVESHEFGRQCVDLLEHKGVKCIHVFDEDKQLRKSKKLSFYMGSARVKACTIHSFKGWETRTLVVHLAHADSAPALAAAYVALSRLKWHADGSYLTVVCSTPRLEAYGRAWPTFSK